MHATWPDELYADAAWPVALACLQLLSAEPRWIHRRVETVDLLTQELVRRQISVDFTLPEPLLDDLRIGPDGPWCAPIAILEKRPLRNFDLREHDEWRPILGASTGGPIAAGVVTAAAQLAIAPDALEPDVASLLEQIARSDLEEARAAMAAAAPGAPTTCRRSRRSSPTRRAATSSRRSRESYMLIALLADEPRGRRILKYAYEEHLRLGGGASRPRRLARRLGWSPFVVDVAVPTAAHAASYHAEVIVPEELRLDAWIVDTRTGELLSTDIERAVDRASLHAPRVALDAEPLLVAAIVPERADLPTLAFATSAVTSLLLLIGAVFGDFGHADRRLVGRAAAGRLGAVRDDGRPQRRAPPRARDLRRAALAAVDRRGGRAGGGRQRRLRGGRRRARRHLVLRRGPEPAGLSQPGGRILPSRIPAPPPDAV